MTYDFKKCEKVCTEALEIVKALKNRNIKGKYDNSEEAVKKAFDSVELNSKKLLDSILNKNYLRTIRKARKLQDLFGYLITELVGTESEDFVPEVARIITLYNDIQNYYTTLYVEP